MMVHDLPSINGNHTKYLLIKIQYTAGWLVIRVGGFTAGWLVIRVGGFTAGWLVIRVGG